MRGLRWYDVCGDYSFLCVTKTFNMKTSKEKSLSMAYKLIKASKGSDSMPLPLLLRSVFNEIEKIKSEAKSEANPSDKA